METLNIIIITVLLTLLIYSLIATIVYIISGENDEILEAFGLGIVGLGFLGVVNTIRGIKHYIKYNCEKRSIIKKVSNGALYRCKTKDTEDIRCWVSGYELVKRYAPKSEWKGLPDFSKEFIDKSKRNCNHCKYDKECDCDFPYDNIKCKHDKYGLVLEFDQFEKGDKK